MFTLFTLFALGARRCLHLLRQHGALRCGAPSLRLSMRRPPAVAFLLLLTVLFSAATALRLPTTASAGARSVQRQPVRRPSTSSPQRWWQRLRQRLDTPLPRLVCRALYVVTTVNPLLFVLMNSYDRAAIRVLSTPRKPTSLAATYIPQIFYFARLKPRLLFVIGGMLRGLQLTTPIRFAFDPPAGCGAGLNILCLSWLKTASTLFDDTVPSARLVPPKALAAPVCPRARREPIGSLRWPQQLASGRPKAEELPLSPPGVSLPAHAGQQQEFWALRYASPFGGSSAPRLPALRCPSHSPGQERRNHGAAGGDATMCI